jgi:hypothetical protein
VVLVIAERPAQHRVDIALVHEDRGDERRSRSHLFARLGE